MNRAEKEQALEGLNERFDRTALAVVTDYRGLNVAEITELRSKLRAAEGEYLVSKNTLTRIAINDTANAPLADWLAGPIAIAFGYGDPVGIAKVIDEFAEDHEQLDVKGAVLEGEVLDKKQLGQLAKMPGKDELRAKLLAVLSAPASQFVRVLNAPAQNLVQVLNARNASQEE